jgi:hypothetical protein
MAKGGWVVKLVARPLAFLYGSTLGPNPDTSQNHKWATLAKGVVNTLIARHKVYEKMFFGNSTLLEMTFMDLHCKDCSENRIIIFSSRCPLLSPINCFYL